MELDHKIVGKIVGTIIGIVCCVIGCFIEKSHYNNILKREKKLKRQSIVTFGNKNLNSKRRIKKIEFVSGEVVVCSSPLNNFIGGIQNFLGGNVSALESFHYRAKREALLRMQENANGANVILNFRVNCTIINRSEEKKGAPRCLAIAYGTAITYE